MRSRPLYDIVALLARLGVGIVFIAHGWQKIQVGITATSKSFDQLGVPAPTAAAIYATFTELLGGLALIAGLGLPVAGTLLFLEMAGAFFFVHAENALFLVDQGRVENGFELVLVLGLASLLFAAGAGGRLTMDSRLFPRRSDRTREDDDPEPWPPPEDPSAPWPPPEDTAETRSYESRAAETRAAEARAAEAKARRAASTTQPDLMTRRARRRGGAGPDPAESHTEAPAKPKSGRFRRKAKAGPVEEPEAPAPSAEPAEPTGPTGPTKPAKPTKPVKPIEAAEPAAEPAERTERAPRLASDIISDTSQDVRVAGKRKPPSP